jgi:hypothetical protein
MTSTFRIGEGDVERMSQLIRDRSTDSFVLERRARNVDGPAPAFDREQFWQILLGCLLTTQQRSTKGSPVDRFVETTPFPLSLARCKQGTETTIREVLTQFGGIRMAPTIARRAAENLRWLENGGWHQVEQHFGRLASQRGRAAHPYDKTAEREACRFAAAELEGIGPKQSRNLWQWLGLTRYEIPVDSRIAKWIKANLSAQVEPEKLGDDAYYEAVLDYINDVCQRAGVLPCVFDAAGFDYTNLGDTVRAEPRGTTTVGYVNPNGQVTIRSTGLPGTDHLQYVYQLACSHCGENYGANGTDIHDRKCPKCQGGAPGLPLSKSQAVEAK